jgi:hypothetical protein
MPKIAGPKAYSLTGTLREQDDQEEFSPPENGITPAQIYEDELLPHYYAPNFLRPLPVEEEDERSNIGGGLLGEGDRDFLNDELDAIWLIPGMLPEPYWDYTMCQDVSTSTVRTLLSRAIKMVLKEDEERTLIRALKIDQELVFHIGMTP